MTATINIGLTFGFIVFFLDLTLLCIFLSRVRISFNKHILDDDWQRANDYWLKLSRVSGVMFCLFHIGIMTIVLTEILSANQENAISILSYNGVAHMYWLLQSLWILIANLAIVLITQRMFRVYKTTSTPFTPLKDWIMQNQKLIQSFIWTVYVLIILSIITQYIMIISSKPNEYFDIQLTIINAIRNFCTAIVLLMQLTIACFFSYIAYKSQQQTNWNQQSQSIICKETAKLAFVVILLALIVAVILYTASWYLRNLKYKTSLNMPFNNANQRIFWSILEFSGFWLILYLTRLRKPVSDNDELPSRASKNSKLFLTHALSAKQRKKALKQFKIEKLQQRKREFQEREKKRKYVQRPSFNTIFIKQVAKYEKEKRLKLKLMAELQQKHVTKSPTKSINNTKHSELGRHGQSDGLLHMRSNNTTQIPSATPSRTVSRTHTLDIVEEDDNKNVKLSLNLDLPDMEDVEIEMMETPVPSHVNRTELEQISTTPMIARASTQMPISSTPTTYALTPRHGHQQKAISIVITPADPDTYADINRNTSQKRNTSAIKATFWNEAEGHDYDTDEDYENVINNIGFISAMRTKISAAFTPHPDYENEQKIELQTFPNVRVLSSDKEDARNSGFMLQFDAERKKESMTVSSTHKNINLLDITDDEETNDLSIIDSDERKSGNSMDEIVGIYMDAFEEEIKEKEHDFPDIACINTASMKQQSGDFTDLMFDNIHLKPRLLKRSHSAPDIRLRDKIWDQVLFALKENKNNNKRDFSIKESRRTSITGDYPKDDSQISHMSQVSHQTQLSYHDMSEFNVFSWFDNKKKNNETRKKGGNHVHATNNRHSLEIPKSGFPVDMIQQNNKPQRTAVNVGVYNETKNNDIDNVSVDDLSKLKTHSNGNKKLKSRINRKNQTKQWINNVHQVF